MLSHGIQFLRIGLVSDPNGRISLAVSLINATPFAMSDDLHPLFTCLVLWSGRSDWTIERDKHTRMIMANCQDYKLSPKADLHYAMVEWRSEIQEKQKSVGKPKPS